MRTILAQLAKTFGALIVLYGFIAAVSFVIAPADETGPMDSGAAGDTIYSSAPKYIYFQRTALTGSERNVLIVGASNADVGLRPAEIKTSVPCAAVNGLTIGNMNITEMRQTVDLVHAVQAPESRRNNTFVFGVWYGDFGDGWDRWRGPSHKNAETDIEVELYRYGFYAWTPQGPEARLPASMLPLERIILRPFHLAERVMRHMTSAVRETFFVRTRFLTVAEREARQFSSAEQKEALDYWDTQMGGRKDLSADQFRQFKALIASLLNGGERVVVVDLPIPRWHEQASVYAARYRALLPEAIAEFHGRPGFSFASMPDLDADDSFSDEVHPKPHLSAIWADRVGKIVGAAACPVITSASR